MKKTKIGIIVFVIFIAMGLFFRLVGFHYPCVIENQPLNSPVKVINIKENELFLADSKIVKIDDRQKRDWDKSSITSDVSQQKIAPDG